MAPALPGELAIDGVDAAKALEHFHGDTAVLADVLRSYALNTPPLLENLAQYLAAGNLEEYATVVHGIKGSTYAIMADKAGALAEELEAAALAGAHEVVEAQHAFFEHTILALLKDIEKALATPDTRVQQTLKNAPDAVLLEELRAACESFDMDRVDAAMSELEVFHYENGEELVIWLRKQINNMAFEEITAGEWLTAHSELAGTSQTQLSDA